MLWTAHAFLTALVVAVYAVVALLVHHRRFPQLGPGAYPQLPPLAVTLFLFRRASTRGALFHAAAFSFLNLLPLVAPGASAELLATPSLAAFAAVLALSVWFWVASVRRGARYQGRRYLAFCAALNLTAFVALAAALLYVWNAHAAHPQLLRADLLWFNGALYLGLLLVFFPYLGEVP